MKRESQELLSERWWASVELEGDWGVKVSVTIGRTLAVSFGTTVPEMIASFN